MYFIAKNVTIEDDESVQTLGRKLINKEIPGILDIFPDINFHYNPMQRSIQARIIPKYTTDDETLYNKIMLLNGNNIEHNEGHKNFMMRYLHKTMGDNRHRLEIKIKKTL